MDDLESSVVQLCEAYRLAVFERGVDSLLRLYDPNVRVFDAWGVWSYEGAGPWRKAVEGWLSSLGSERVRVAFDDLQILGGSGFAVASAIVTYAAVSAEGEELRAMQNRLTWTLRADEGAWRIVHEHTSAPLGFDDGKAILKRPASS